MAKLPNSQETLSAKRIHAALRSIFAGLDALWDLDVVLQENLPHLEQGGYSQSSLAARLQGHNLLCWRVASGTAVWECEQPLQAFLQKADAVDCWFTWEKPVSAEKLSALVFAIA